MNYDTNIIISIILMVYMCLSSYQQQLDYRTMNFTEIGNTLGHAVREYDVITQDAYILKLFNIPGDRNRPVLLMHGIIDSADTFIIRGNTSLAIALANAGYDVWVGNTRGSRYSRRHVYLDPDVDVEFWDYSFHESGLYDLPAIIDFILDNNKVKSLSTIGHSQGNTIFLVLGALRPDYNKKIKVLISLSPICYLRNVKNFVYYLINSVPTIDQIFTVTGQEEFLGDDTKITRLYRTICGCRECYKLCAYGIIFPLAGSDPEEFEPEFYETLVAHYPTGTSKKNVVHTSQVALRKSFSEFDYGGRNMFVYNSTEPPDYNLSGVTMKVALIAGRNDEISTLEDVKLLRNKLPNVVDFIVVKHKLFNHLDAVWGRNMNVYLFPHIFEILSKYNS